MKSIRSKEMDLYSHLLGQALNPTPLSSPAFKLSGCPVPHCARVRVVCTRVQRLGTRRQPVS